MHEHRVVDIWLSEQALGREGHHAATSVLAFSLNTSSLIFLVQPTPTATQSILAAIHQGKGHCGLTPAARLVAPSGSEGSLNLSRCVIFRQV